MKCPIEGGHPGQWAGVPTLCPVCENDINACPVWKAEFTCPVCHAASWNRNDRIHGYCARCKAFTAPPLQSWVGRIMQRLRPPPHD